MTFSIMYEHWKWSKLSVIQLPSTILKTTLVCSFRSLSHTTMQQIISAQRKTITYIDYSVDS